MNINLANRQPPVWLEESYWKPMPGQQYLWLPIVQKDLPPRRERRQSSERASTKRSITPYRHYVPYRNSNPLEFQGLADEKSGEISLPISSKSAGAFSPR